jgi:glycosyltransferase involved in cell wall biosynthesis
MNNLVNVISNDFNISAVTSAYDLKQTTPMEEVQLGNWNKMGNIRVRYLLHSEINFSNIKRLMFSENADTIYLNGMFSLPFTFYPLWLWKNNKHAGKKICIAPRGMLQEGALKSKKFKKILYLNTLKFLGLHKNVVWHATDIQEKKDIKFHFGEKSKIDIVPDTPRPCLEKPFEITKQKGELKLIYLSLIAEKKNLHLALSWLKDLIIPVSFDIYGPVKDEMYWNQCNKIISELPANIKVNYKGLVNPAQVQEAFAKYHAFFFPTKGENFGHVIYECLGAGRPVIISDKTPWNNLQEKKGGFDLCLDSKDNFLHAIINLHSMDQEEYNHWIKGSFNIAKEYWNNNDFHNEYVRLFN